MTVHEGRSEGAAWPGPWEALLPRNSLVSAAYLLGPTTRSALLTFAVLAIYEITKHLVFPAITLWQSHVITVVLGTGLAAVITRRVLRRQSHAHEHARQLAAIVESTTDAIISRALDGTILSWNSGAERLYGYRASEMLGRSARLFLPPENCSELTETANRAGRGETIPAFESVRVSKDGRRIDVSVMVSPIHDRSGRVVALASVARDNRERRRAVEALRASEAQFRRLFENSPIGIYRTTPEGRILLANPVVVRLSGYASFEELAARNLEQEGTLAGYPRAEFKRRLERDGEVRGLEIPWLRKDGSVSAFVRENARVVRGPDGNVCYYEGTLEDISEQKQAEIALRASEARYRHLFESNPQPMWAYDVETLAFLAVNDAAVRQYGYSRDEFLGMTIKDIRPPEEVADLLATLQRPIPANQPAQLTRHRWRDGTVRDVRVSSHIIQYGDRQARLVLAWDITEQRRAEAERQRTAQLLHAVAEETTDAVFVKDREGKYLLFNQAAAQLVGKPAAEVLGRDDTAVFDPDSARHVMERDRQILLAGRADTEEEVLTASGVTRTYLATKAPYRDEQGQVLGLIGISRDITERIKAEAQVTLFRTLLDGARDTIEVIDPETGRFLDVNEQGLQLHGYTREEYLTLTVADVDPVVGGKPWHEVLEKRQRSDFRSFESRHRRKDGSTFPVEVSLSLVRLDRDYLLAVVRDITERKQIEDQLRQSQKMEGIGQLAGGIAHDFNNLLTVINGHSELLLPVLSPGSPQRDAAAAIRDAGERAARLTQQLLAFSRKAIIEPKVLDLNEAVSHTSRMLRRLIGEDILLTTVLAPVLSRVKMDPGQVEQVLMNLAVNARDAMPGGGRLTIETRDVQVFSGDTSVPRDLVPGHYVQLCVADTGCGMSEEVQARVFEPFFTTKEVGKGTGLGLATVYGIVKTYGGHIGLESKVGVGTTITILLPAVVEAARESSAHGARTAPRGNETVLLVEDEAAVRGVARLALQAQGYQILEAESGAAALQSVSRHAGPVDLLLTDVVMPGMSGRTLAEALQRQYPDLKVLYMSGHTDDAVIRSGVANTRDVLLQKPFTLLGLAQKVRAVLDGRSQAH